MLNLFHKVITSLLLAVGIHTGSPTPAPVQTSPSPVTTAQSGAVTTVPNSATETKSEEGLPKNSPKSAQKTTPVSTTNDVPMTAKPAVTPPTLEVPILTTPSPSSLGYDEKTFVNDIAAVYNPFNSQFFFYSNRVVSSVDSGNLSDAKSWLNTAMPFLKTARDGVANIKAKYPTLSLDDSTALNNLSDGINEMYLNMNIYSSLVDTNILYPVPQLTDYQVSQINKNDDMSNAKLQSVHDFLVLNTGNN